MNPLKKLQSYITQKKQQVSEAKKESNVVEEKSLKVLDSIAQLLTPFKEVLLAVFPASRKILLVVELFGRLIRKIILVVLRLIPLLRVFSKGKVLKFLVTLVVLVLILDAVVSRMFNSATYKSMIAGAISESTGYTARLEGNIKVNFLLLKFSIDNASFIIPNSKSNTNNIYLSQLNVNQIRVYFEYLPALLGKFIVKKVDLVNAGIVYKTPSVVSTSTLTNYDYLRSQINDLTNLKIVINDNQSKFNNTNTDNNNFINKLEDVDNINNLKKDNTLDQTNNIKDVAPTIALNDNKEKYLNLSGVFSEKKQNKEIKYVQVNKHGFIYNLLTKVISNAQFSFRYLSELNFKNTQLIFANPQDKVIISFTNLAGNLEKTFLGNDGTIKGSGRFLNKDIFFEIYNSKEKEKQKLNITASYSDDTLNKKDIEIATELDKSILQGTVKLSGIGFKNIVSTTLFDLGKVDETKMNFTSNFTYNDALLDMPNMKFNVYDKVNTGKLRFDLSDNNTLELTLDLKVPNLNPIFTKFSNHKKENYVNQNSFGNIVDILADWHSNKLHYISPKIISLNINIDDTLLNNTNIKNLTLNSFIDEDNNLYVNDFSIHDDKVNFETKGKISLINKSGIVSFKTNSSLSSLCSFLACNDNLVKFVQSFAGEQDVFNFAGILFADMNRFVVNNVSGNIGNKVLQDTNATILERNGNSDIVISTNFDSIDFYDLKRVYQFNKTFTRMYYNNSTDFTGLPENINVNLNIYSTKFNYKNLVFNNFQMESSLINSGILVRNFQFVTEDNAGSVKGSFNFDAKVSPVLVGNVNITNLLLDAKDLQEIIFSNYSLTGKVMLNGNLNFAGDNYYDGINKVNGSLDLVKYERLKVNQNNQTDGFYLTLVEFKQDDKNVYQIGDLYGKVKIVNNIAKFDPNVIRFMKNKNNYRGNFTGELNLIKNQFNLNGSLQSESNASKKLDFKVDGSLKNAIVQALN